MAQNNYNVGDGVVLTTPGSAAAAGGDPITVGAVTGTPDLRTSTAGARAGQGQCLILNAVAADQQSHSLVLATGSLQVVGWVEFTVVAGEVTVGDHTLFRHRTSSANVFKGVLTTGGLVRVQQVVGTTVTGLKTFYNGTRLPDGWYAVAVGLQANATTATAGQVIVNLYDLGSGQLVTDGTFTSSTVNLGTAAITTQSWAKPEIGATLAGLRYDNVKFSTGTTMYTPPANTPPAAANPAPQNVAAGAAFSATVAATDDSAIASYAWSVVTGESTATSTLTGANTATVSGTAPAAGNLVVLQCIITDDGGLATTVKTEIRTPLSGAFTTLALSGQGDAWSNIGGATSGGAALADATDSTYIESLDYTTAASERRWRLQPLTARGALTLTPRTQVTAAGGTTKFRLYEGNTLRQEWDQPQHTGWADDSVTLTNPAAISDWCNLWVAESVVS